MWTIAITVSDPIVPMLMLVLVLMLYLQSFACTDIFYGKR
jgi:hypothetical protein